MEKHCPTCQCSATPPTYPVTCPLCCVQYGPGYDPASHRPGSDNYKKRQLERAEKPALLPHLGLDKL